MKHPVHMAVVLLAVVTAACGTKKEETETAPPGFCKTAGECQPMADRQQAYQNNLRQQLLTQGVHNQFLPCGMYKPSHAPNGYWTVAHDTTGCPPTASQQDPHPDAQSAKQSKKEKGETPK